MDGEWAVFFGKLVDVSPYLLVLIAMAVVFYMVFKVSTNAQKDLVEKTIGHLKESQEVVIKALQSTYTK